MNKIIIDGYNLIRRVPELAKYIEVSLERARDELLRLLKSYTMSKQVEIIVAFDGQQPPLGIDAPYDTRRLKVRFSRQPFKADPMIKNMIASAAKPKSVAVVTDDGDIRRFAVSKRASVISSPDFFHLLIKRSERKAADQSRDHNMSEDELAEWLKLFEEGGTSE